MYAIFISNFSRNNSRYTDYARGWRSDNSLYWTRDFSFDIQRTVHRDTFLYS